MSLPASSTALVIHHDADSSVGLLGDAFATAGYRLVEHTVCPRIGDATADGPLPDLDDHDADVLVLLGSRWSTYDRARVGGWIDEELAMIRRASDRGMATLGICFGAQVLATALGGSVSRAPISELGWSTIVAEPTAHDYRDSRVTAHDARAADVIGSGPWFQWHHDAFTVPPGAVGLARSAAGPQAFRSGRHLGVQFHPEVDRALLELWVNHDPDDLVTAGIDPAALIDETERRSVEVAARTHRLVRWFLDGPAA